MSIKKLAAAMMAAILLLSFSACSLFDGGGESEGSEPEPQETESSEPEPVDPNWPAEAAGVTLERAPEGVVSLSPELTEHIGDLGLIGRLAAVSDYCDWPEQAAGLEKAGTVQSINFEALDGLAPKYIIAQSMPAEADLVQLQQRNIEVAVFPTVSSVEELYGLLRELALFFEGKEDGAPVSDALIDKYRAALEDIAAPVDSYRGEGAAKKAGAYVRVLDYTMATGGTLEGELLQTYVFDNAAAGFTGWEYPADQWASFAADILFVNTDTVIKDLEQSANYKGLKAVYNDAVYQVDMDLLARGGLRALEILRGMAVTAWPEAFPEETPLSPAYPSMYKEA